MNVWLSQSYETLAELMEICSTEANFTTSQHSRPIIAMKQDAMTGGYLLTYGDVKIDKATFFDCLMCLEDFDVMAKYDHIRDVYKWKGIEQEIENKLIEERKTLITKQSTLTETKISLVSKFKKAKDSDKNDLKNKISNINTKLKDIDARLSLLIDDNFEVTLEEELMFNGRTLFSFLFPDDFEYTFQNNMDANNKPVHITRGVMLTGTLNKAIIGSAAGSVSHIIRLNYSARRAIEFVSYYQMIINRWLLTRGFSVGIEDCIPNHLVDKKPNRLNLSLKPKHLVDYKNDNILMEMKTKCVVSDKPAAIKHQESNFIKTETTKCFSKALLYMQTEEDDELKELKVNNALNNARDIGQRIAKESLSPYNSFVAMIRSGAKGNDNNITQITSMLGQQNAEGKRMPLVFGNRALPHFSNNLEELMNTKESSASSLEHLFASRGFVHSGFFKGLTPYEFFFHTVGGREGLIDTACKTADTGYIQRKMVKLLEDLQVTYRGTVEDSSKNIISFDYGGDNFDGAKVIYRGGDPLFMDVETICNKLNSDYEWKLYNETKSKKIEVIEEEEKEETIEEKQEVYDSSKFEFDKNDVDIFFDDTTAREDNGNANEIRESILEQLRYLPQDYEQDETYGKKWCTLKTEFEKAIGTSNYKIVKKGGRKYNYDFEIVTKDKTIKMEFKHNCSSVNSLPEILQLSTKNHPVVSGNYGEYFYEKYLKKMCDVMKITDIPSKQDYLKNVYTDKPKGDFFTKLKETNKKLDKETMDKKNSLVKESICKFLNEHISNVDVNSCNEHLGSSLDKTFYLWDTEKFTVEEVNDIGELKVSGISNNNTLLICSDKYVYKYLLRWKNGIGVLNPAWQISMKGNKK